MTLAELKQLPLWLDGSDGSMWPARATVDDVDLLDGAERYYVRLDYLLALCPTPPPLGETPV
jgi:hypothetical protein